MDNSVKQPQETFLNGEANNLILKFKQKEAFPGVSLWYPFSEVRILAPKQLQIWLWQPARAA